MRIFKTLFVATIALCVAACTTEEPEPKPKDPTTTSYEGDVCVTAPSGTVSNFEDKTFDVTLTPTTKLAKIVMNEVQFNAMMPAKTMVVDSLPYVEVDGKVMIDASGVVPSIATRPYPDYTFSTLAVEIENNTLFVYFSSIGHAVAFTGAAVGE